MKREATKEITICDACGKEVDLGSTCDTCGKDLCWDCRKENLVVYNHAVYFSGSGDGKYCVGCDANHRSSGTDERWNAYQEIVALKEEMKAFGEDFKKRQDAAESLVKKFS